MLRGVYRILTLRKVILLKDLPKDSRTGFSATWFQRAFMYISG
jgi:hypothetical protein